MSKSKSCLKLLQFLLHVHKIIPRVYECYAFSDMSMWCTHGLLVTLMVGALWVLQESEGLKISAFNVQVFGKTKAGKTDVMDILVKVCIFFGLN